MINWSEFPTRTIDTGTPLFRVHQHHLHPGWFNTDGSWRFDPMASHRARFGVCYLGLESLAAYVEVFGRIKAVPRQEIDRRRLSEITLARRIDVADLADRTVLGDFGITAAHSTGTDYGPAQEVATNLFDAGFDGILYRVRHDPAMALEGIALFGEPGETPDRFESLKIGPIPDFLVADGQQFRIEVLPSSPLP